MTRTYIPKLHRLTPPEERLDLARLAEGREARLEALGAYMRGLPVSTNNEWEFLTCILTDLHAAWEARQATRPGARTPPLGSSQTAAPMSIQTRGTAVPYPAQRQSNTR